MTTTFARKSFQDTEVEPRVSHELKIKRVYEKPEPGDGTRILVDRLWPRGLSKAKAKRSPFWERDLGKTLLAVT